MVGPSILTWYCRSAKSAFTIDLVTLTQRCKGAKECRVRQKSSYRRVRHVSLHVRGVLAVKWPGLCGLGYLISGYILLTQSEHTPWVNAADDACPMEAFIY